LTSREYRYLSPAFLHTKKMEIMSLVSAGLTNRPALVLKALAHATYDVDEVLDADAAVALAAAQPNSEENTVDKKELCKRLGLAEDSTDEQILAACAALKKAGVEAVAKLTAVQTELATARQAQPALDKFVPRADYDVALARAEKAEQVILAEAAKALEVTIDVEIDTALKARKITPATVDYHRAQCTQQGGLERFRTFVAAAPVVAPDSDLDDKDLEKDQKKLSEDQLAVARNCGLTPEAYLAAL
jgi:phage I-like protein